MHHCLLVAQSNFGASQRIGYVWSHGIEYAYVGLNCLAIFIWHQASFGLCCQHGFLLRQHDGPQPSLPCCLNHSRDHGSRPRRSVHTIPRLTNAWPAAGAQGLPNPHVGGAPGPVCCRRVDALYRGRRVAFKGQQRCAVPHRRLQARQPIPIQPQGCTEAALGVWVASKDGSRRFWLPLSALGCCFPSIHKTPAQKPHTYTQARSPCPLPLL